MDQLQPLRPDLEAFRRVWRRVAPADRPDCPFTLPPPQVPVPLCLGEGSARDLPVLERAMTHAHRLRRAYLAMAARRRAPLLSSLAREKEARLRRLEAAYYLIAGRPFGLPAAPPPASGGLTPFLRDRCREEQAAAGELLTAAGTAADPCLSALLLETGEEHRAAARRLFGALERLPLPPEGGQRTGEVP